MKSYMTETLHRLLIDAVRKSRDIIATTPFAVHLRKIYNHLRQQLKL